MRHAWEGDSPTHTSIYRDAHGEWISGYARVLDSRGEPVAIVEVDAETSALFAKALANGWPLALGVGLHSGRAVVGAIGSDTRRDFTAIGHAVNLASRLCDHAEAWQILVSADFLTALPGEEQARFQPTEPIAFKNIQHAVRTYACTETPEVPATDSRSVDRGRG